MAELDDDVLRHCGRVDLDRDKVLAFARTLRADDEVVLEVIGNTMAAPQAARGQSDDRQPAAGSRHRGNEGQDGPDLRNLVSRRSAIVQGMTRTTNRIHAVLHANLIPHFGSKLFMAPGRKWLAKQPLAEDQWAAVNRSLAGLDAMETDLTAAGAAIASACIGDDRVRRLMTTGGVNISLAAGTSRGMQRREGWRT